MQIQYSAYAHPHILCVRTQLTFQKLYRWQHYTGAAFRPVYRTTELSETDLDILGGSETENERRTFVRRRHLVRSNKFSRKRSGQKYIKRVLSAQRKGLQVMRPVSIGPEFDACRLDEKATGRSLRHVRAARYRGPFQETYLTGRSSLYVQSAGFHGPQREGDERLQYRRTSHSWESDGDLECKQRGLDICVPGWPQPRTEWPGSSFQTRYFVDNGSDADDEMPSKEPDIDDNPFLALWRWHESDDRARYVVKASESFFWPDIRKKRREIYDEADYLVRYKPGSSSMKKT